jgi:hypothetical protein
MVSIVYDKEKKFYTGSVTGTIYQWEGKSVVSTVDFFTETSNKTISALAIDRDHLYASAYSKDPNDFCVKAFDLNNKLNCTSTVKLSSFAKSIDVVNG